MKTEEKKFTNTPFKPGSETEKKWVELRKWVNNWLFYSPLRKSEAFSSEATNDVAQMLLEPSLRELLSLTPPKVEVTEERLRAAWKSHVSGKAIPNYLAFKKELGL